MLKGLDLASPAMTEAEMTRDELEAALKQTSTEPLDLTGKPPERPGPFRASIFPARS